jgi:hypothetical protein
MVTWLVASVVVVVSTLVTYRVLPRRWERRARWTILVLGFFFSSVVIGVYARQAEHDLQQLRLPVIATTTTTIHRHR